MYTQRIGDEEEEYCWMLVLGREIRMNGYFCCVCVTYGRDELDEFYGSFFILLNFLHVFKVWKFNRLPVHRVNQATEN